MTLFNVEFSLSLRILGLDHYLFSCSHQVFAYVVSRKLHFDPIHLFIRSLWNYIDFCHYNENHFFHACLIIKYHMHFLWQAFQNMRLCISTNCLILNIFACHFEYHTLQQASFGYWSKLFIINTYFNSHDNCCLLLFSY